MSEPATVENSMAAVIEHVEQRGYTGSKAEITPLLFRLVIVAANVGAASQVGPAGT